MENFKGTWGEWSVEQTDSTGITITNDNGRQAIAFIPPLYEKSTANALLIAAAPELLKACQLILDDHKYYGHLRLRDNNMDIIRKAIQKALEP